MDLDDFNNTFSDPLMEKLKSENKEIFLAGDFNIDLMKNELNSTSTFLNILTANLFVPHIIIPTRITSSSKTLIDNILSNSLNFSSAISGVLSNTISDHLPQHLILLLHLRVSSHTSYISYIIYTSISKFPSRTSYKSPKYRINIKLLWLLIILNTKYTCMMSLVCQWYARV